MKTNLLQIFSIANTPKSRFPDEPDKKYFIDCLPMKAKNKMSQLNKQLNEQLNGLAKKIYSTKRILLTTHKMPDGDGLGSLVGMYHGLRKIGKEVRIVTVDKTSKRYHFILNGIPIESFDNLKNPIEKIEIALICDTNDRRLIEPLYEELEKKSEKIIFIDHHPVLNKKYAPTLESIIHTRAASTGEICYFLLKQMNIAFDPSIAMGIYTSVLFDTQRFHFVKNSSTSYEICAEIFQYIENNELFYNQLFGMSSKEKINLLAEVIKRTEYFHTDEVAILQITKAELEKNGMEVTEACNFIDMIMEVRSTKLAVMIVKLSENNYKLSFRSRDLNVSKLAELFGGGGHRNSSGAILVNYTKDVKQEILNLIQTLQLVA